MELWKAETKSQVVVTIVIETAYNAITQLGDPRHGGLVMLMNH